MTGTVVATVAARIFDVALRRGVNEAELTRTLRRKRTALTEDARVPIGLVYDAFALCLRQTRDPSLPIQVASEIQLEDYAVLGFAFLTSDSPDDSLQRLARFGHLITDSGRWSLERDPTNRLVRLTWLRAGPRSLGHRAANECAIAEVVNGFRRVLGTRFNPSAIRFRHARPNDVRAHVRFFRAPLEWLANADGLDISEGLLALRSPDRNPAMNRFFAGLLEVRGKGTESVSDQLRGHLAQQLPSGPPLLNALARKLGMSERTLRRKLRAERTSFRALLDEVRRTSALELFRAGRSVTEAAFLLGFSETSALSRAYRRWHGSSPRNERRRKPRGRGS
jgi:AraC-like DNA-binding protein